MVGAQAAAVGEGDAVTDCQPQTRTAAGAVTRGFTAIEAFEQPGQLLRVDAGAGIHHIDAHLIALQGGTHLHSAASIGVAHRVFQKVADQLLQASGVCVHRQKGDSKLQSQLQLTGSTTLLEHVRDVRQQLRQVTVDLAVGQGTHIRQGQLIQVIHQLAEHADLALQ